MQDAFYRPIGVDITHISRFEKADINFAKRILSIDEFNQFIKLKTEQKALFLARAWAIKEAIFKANNKYYRFSQINLKKYNNRWHFLNFSISISHDQDILIAFVLENVKENYEKNRN
ncbi:4'-phosphopantetheinyl transferase superfamily protein [Mycoplasma sp. NEAQ87857]|nr:4'-phosphopantetheinyl transferase superfamily protein [Mycoplasma sp. NEAQ87857]